MNHFTENLKRSERAFGIRTADLADYLGLPPETVKSWEVGMSEPNLEQLRLLCEYFETPADYLIGLNDRPMVDVSGLDDSQIGIIQELILVMAQRNRNESRKALIIPVNPAAADETKSRKP